MNLNLGPQGYQRSCSSEQKLKIFNSNYNPNPTSTRLLLYLISSKVEIELLNLGLIRVLHSFLVFLSDLDYVVIRGRAKNYIFVESKVLLT